MQNQAQAAPGFRSALRHPAAQHAFRRGQLGHSWLCAVNDVEQGVNGLLAHVNSATRRWLINGRLKSGIELKQQRAPITACPHLTFRRTRSRVRSDERHNGTSSVSATLVFAVRTGSTEKRPEREHCVGSPQGLRVQGRGLRRPMVPPSWLRCVQPNRRTSVRTKCSTRVDYSFSWGLHLMVVKVRDDLPMAVKIRFVVVIYTSVVLTAGINVSR